jgi:hypothetical protein
MWCSIEPTPKKSAAASAVPTSSAAPASAEPVPSIWPTSSARFWIWKKPAWLASIDA